MVVAKDWRLDELKIETDYGDVAARNLKWLKSWPIDTPGVILRKEFEEKGVIHIKNVMPRDYVQGVRAEFFKRVAPSGVLKEGTDPVDGIWCGHDEGRFHWPYTGSLENEKDMEYAKLAAKWHTDSESADFSSNPYLMDIVSRVQPEFVSPFCLRRQIFRAKIPQSLTRTGIHYDQIYLRHGTVDSTMTAWVPLGDIRPHDGGLIYLEDSVKSGRRIEDGYSQMGEDKSMSDEERRGAYNSNMSAGAIPLEARDSLIKEDGSERKWYVGNYEAGDVVFHHMYMIHASGQNLATDGRIRLSADLRFADGNQQFDPRWNNPFIPGDML